MRCASCGGFYNQACPHWPQCSPWVEDDKVERWFDWGFKVYCSFVLGAIFAVLCAIWVKL